jgi:hypothetical protein
MVHCGEAATAVAAFFAEKPIMGVKNTGAVVQLQDTDLISVTLTFGSAKALLSALTRSTPPAAVVANNVSLALVRAMSSPSAKGPKGTPKTPPVVAPPSKARVLVGV